MLTFMFVELGVESQGDLSRADVQQLVLVVFRTSEFAHNLAEWIVLGGAESRNIINNEIVDGEDVRKLDVQCRLSAGKEVVELVNLKVCFRVANIDEV
jgi:hypothetical protein